MTVQITIRNVPNEIRDELASRAALEGRSMQEFLRAELENLARRPSMATWLEQVRARKRAAGTRIDPQDILDSRDADRR